MIIFTDMRLSLALLIGAMGMVLACSNAFLLPTHQINALIMGPGNYRVADFMRVGRGLSVMFIAVLIGMINLLY